MFKTETDILPWIRDRIHALGIKAYIGLSFALREKFWLGLSLKLGDDLHFATRSRRSLFWHVTQVGINWSKLDKGGFNMMMTLAKFNDTSLMKGLLACGVPTDQANGKGDTPLSIAVRHNNTGCLSLMSDAGADLSEVDTNGRTLLMQAICSEASHAVRYLMGKKIDINARDDNGDTALHFALAAKGCGVALTLITEGADAYISNRYGKTAISVARERNMRSILELLEKEREARNTASIANGMPTTKPISLPARAAKIKPRPAPG